MDFIQRYDDSRAITGVGSALFVKLPSETKFHLFLALETTPFVVGETASHEFSLTTSPFIGKVKGKTTLDNKDVEFLWHRDNLVRLQEFDGLTLDFLAIAPDYTAQQFRASFSYKPNDLVDDVAKGTLTLIPNSVEDPIIDCRDLIMGTVVVTNAIQDSFVLATAAGTATQVIELNTSGATVTITSNTTAVSATETSGVITITGNNVSLTDIAYGILTVVVSKTGLASSTTTIAVEIPVALA